MTTSNNDNNHDQLPTSTAHQARLRLFQPTRRPQRTEREILTAWGRVRVVGRLGQAHADVLEAMFSTAEGRGTITDSDGNERIKLLVDPARVRAAARQPSGTTLQRVLDDLVTALIEIREPKPLRCIGHLVDQVDIATKRDGSKVTKSNPLGGKRDMWRVTIGQTAMHLIHQDLHLNYNPATIAGLRHGVSQALARLILGHDPARQPNGGWHLDTLIRQVVGDLSDMQMRDRRRELRADAQSLRLIGIVLIDGDRVRVEHKHGARP